MMTRWKLTLTVAIVTAIVVVLAYVIHFISMYLFDLKLRILQRKICDFLINYLLLLIIPSTETFFKLIDDEDFKGKWFAFVSLIYNPFLLPLILFLVMIIISHPNIEEKYKQCKYNVDYYFEFLDIAVQIGYAIAAALVSLLSCIIIEIVWFVLI